MKDNPQRMLLLGYAKCDVCGEEFRKYNGRQKRCCPECAEIGEREQEKIYKANHRPKNPPREITCIKCGELFIGRSNQAICHKCLTTRKECKRYLDLRSERMKIGG